jgi:hypothetical protein
VLTAGPGTFQCVGQPLRRALLQSVLAAFADYVASKGRPEGVEGAHGRAPSPGIGMNQNAPAGRARMTWSQASETPSEGAAGPIDKLEAPHGATLWAGALGAILSWTSGIGLALVSRGADLQLSDAVESQERLRAMVAGHPQLLLKAMAWDGLFVTGYVVVFCALFALTRRNGRLVAALGLLLCLVAGACDMVENALYVVYALGALHHAAVAPDVPVHYYLSALKWSSAFAGIGVLALVFPRRDSLDRAASWAMISFPVLGGLSTAYPSLAPLRGLFFLIGMPVFAWLFFSRAAAGATLDEDGAA